MSTGKPGLIEFIELELAAAEECLGHVRTAVGKLKPLALPDPNGYFVRAMRCHIDTCRHTFTLLKMMANMAIPQEAPEKEGKPPCNPPS